MQTKHLCVLVHIGTKGEVGSPLNWFKLYSKYFYWPFQGDASSVDHLWVFFCLFLLCFHVRLFVDAFWSPAKKRLTPWLSFVMSNCGVVTFLLVSWVRCGAWLYRFLILPSFSPCLDLLNPCHAKYFIYYPSLYLYTFNLYRSRCKRVFSIRVENSPPWLNLRFSLALIICESWTFSLVHQSVLIRLDCVSKEASMRAKQFLCFNNRRI